MTALAVRPVTMTSPLVRTYAAWTISANGHESARRDLAASTLDEAVALCTPPMVAAALAKGGWEPFVILETDDTARTGKARHSLHLFTVKARKEFRRFGEEPYPKQAAVPYAVKLGSMPMTAFEPRRPFDAALDCPANGLQPGEQRMVEVRS